MLQNYVENATTALRGSNFEKFFQELEKITDKRQQSNLITYAVTIAFEQKAVPILVLLAEKWVQLCAEPYTSPLSVIIQKLIALRRSDADSAAISIATLYAGQHESYGSSLWLILCQALLENNIIDKVKLLYRYLVSDHEKRQIASSALEQISLDRNFFEWFAWFVRYLETMQHYSYSNDELLTGRTIAFIIKYQDFAQLMPHIMIANTSKAYEEFIIQLFCKMLFAGQIDRITLLLNKIPESLRWLRDVYATLNDEKAYTIFENSSFSNLQISIQNEIIRIALINLCSRQRDNSADIIGNLILNIVNALPATKSKILELFSEICCQLQRHDIAMYLLKQAIDPQDYSFKDIALLIVQANLSRDNYLFIVQELNAWPDNINIVAQLATKKREGKSYRLDCSYQVKETISILIKIPFDIVLAENARRIIIKAQEHEFLKQKEATAQAELRKQLNLLPDNSVTQRHEHYLNLVMQLEFYIGEKQPQFAFAYIKKIVSSRYKDDYLKQIAILFFDAQQVQLAQASCNLLTHANIQWKEWPQRMQSDKYKKTLDWLIDNAVFSDVKILVQYYVNKIFNQIPTSIALDNLFASKLFTEKKLDLEAYYADKKPQDFDEADDDDMWADVDSDIISVTSGADQHIEKQSLEEMIISKFIMQYADSKKLIKKMGEFKNQGITGFETAILNYHIHRKQWLNASRIINLFAPTNDKKHGAYRLSHIEPLELYEKAVINYFQTKVSFTELALLQVKIIVSEDIRARVLFVLLKKAPLDLYKDNNLVKLTVESINQVTQPGYKFELFCELFNDFKRSQSLQSIIMINDIIIKDVENNDFKNRFFIEYIFNQLINKPLLHKEINFSYWCTALPFWHTMILMIPHPLSLLHYILKNRHEWDQPSTYYIKTQIEILAISLIDQLVRNKDILFDLARLLYNEFNKGDKNNQWSNYEFIKKLYFPCVNQILEQSIHDIQWVVPAVKYFEEEINIDNQEAYNSFIVARLIQIVEKMLENSVLINHPASIRIAFVFILQRSKTFLKYLSPSISKALLGLIKNNQPDLLEELTLMAFSQEYSNLENYSSAGLIQPICEYFINNKQVKKVIIFLNQIQACVEMHANYYILSFKDKKIRIIIKVAQRLAHDNQFMEVHSIYQDYLKPARRDLLAPLLDILIAKNKLSFAQHIILDNGGDPQQILIYQKRITAQHFVRLTGLIKDEYANKLKDYYIAFVLFLQQKDVPALANHAILQRNQLIVGLKNLLDKAFRAYYQKTEGKDPPILPGRLCNFPVPVSDAFKGKTPEIKLQNFIQEFRITKISPELYQYLSQIQPTLDPSYEWLQQLRKMRNDETHNESYLSPILQVDNIVIDDTKFLFNALTGIEKILIKLFNNNITLDELNRYSLNNILSLNAESKHADSHAFGLDQDYSLNQSMPSVYSNLNKMK